VPHKKRKRRRRRREREGEENDLYGPLNILECFGPSL
jgi:hypothetical protein